MEVQIRPARISDIEKILSFMKAYYNFDQLEFNHLKAQSALTNLIKNESYGKVWLVLDEGVEIGYIVITFGYSIEFGGLDAFIDEFFILEDYRKRGAGGRTLLLVEQFLGDMNVEALHLEVDFQNEIAKQFYLSKGFDFRRRFRTMTKRFKSTNAPA